MIGRATSQENISFMRKMNSDGCLIAEIDLKTHKGLIRDIDPLNIYRYSDWYYNTFKFRGSPNRLRSFGYGELILKNHWSDAKVEQERTLNTEYVEKIKPSFNKKVRNIATIEMSFLSVMVLAKR